MVQISGGTLSFHSLPEINGRKSNGTGFITVGATLSRINLAGTFFIKSSALDQVFHLQAQYIPEPGAKWAFSLGGQDIQGRGGSAGDAFLEDTQSSQSLFGVLTYRWDAGRRPIYLSAGIGTRRFGRPFGSISHQIAAPLRIWAESDGYGVNYGLLGVCRLGRGVRAMELNATVGLVKGQYFVFSVGMGL